MKYIYTTSILILFFCWGANCSLSGQPPRTFQTSLDLILSSKQRSVIKITPLDPVSDIVYDKSLDANKATITQTGDTSRLSVEVVYYNNFGLPEQTVQRAFTSDKEDLIVKTEYDFLYREKTRWLPVASQLNNGQGKGRMYTQNEFNQLVEYAYPNDTVPYSTTLYESSPYNRVVEIYGPGQEWYNNHKSVTTEYTANVDSPESVLSCLYFDVSNGSLRRRGYYPANELMVTKMTDEEGKVSYGFQDKRGRVVLQRQMDGTTKHDTYFVYDSRGNQCFVVPPLLSDLLTANTIYTESHSKYADIKALGYIYCYDSRNRCIYKKLPGADHVEYLYDAADRLICTQDGEMRAQGKWWITLPDQYGRVVMEGYIRVKPQISGVVTAQRITNKLICPTGYADSFYGYWIGKGIVVSWYTLWVYKVYYYDNYNFLDDYIKHKYSYYTPEGFVDRLYKNIGYDDGYPEVATKGKLTGAYINRTMGSTDAGGDGRFGLTVYYYDKQGNVIQSISDNHLGGMEEVYTNYSFSGEPTRTEKVHYANATDVAEVDSIKYDHAGRPSVRLRTTYERGRLWGTVKTEFAYDKTGRLKKKKIGSVVKELAYTIRGFVNEISYTNGATTRHFQENLSYDYNGNIGRVDYKYSSSDIDNNNHSYYYYYDGLSRLTGARYISGTVGWYDGYKSEDFTYDKQGNIQTLQRRDGTIGNKYLNTTADDLSFTYSGNRLATVIDHSSHMYDFFGAFEQPDDNPPAVHYGYNKNGSMYYDYNKKIAHIEYNLLNLPDRIQFRDGHLIEYAYNPMSGEKLRTVHTTVKTGLHVPLGQTKLVSGEKMQSQVTRDYCGNVIYENGKLSTVLFEDGYYNSEGHYYLYLQDHLGNNRKTISQWGTTTSTTFYYPSGYTASGSTSIGQRFKFGGKELDKGHGLNMYDFHARQLNLEFPIFTTMDPMAEKYYSISPYAYCANNFVNYTDPTGMWIQIDHGDGNYRYENNELRKYNKETGEYDAFTAKSDAFLNGVLGALNELSKKSKAGNDLLAFFENDENHAYIQATNGKNSIDSSGSVNQISLNKDLEGSKDVPTELGMQESPFSIDVGHELAHRRDFIQNPVSSKKPWLKNGNENIIESEKYATTVENQIRVDMGLPLRTHYGNTNQGTPWEPSRLNVSRNATGNAVINGNVYYPQVKINTPQYPTPVLKLR